MKSPILGGSVVARSVNAADNRLVNLFPEVVPEGGKEPGFLNRAPGLRLLTTVGSGPIRGMWQYGSYGYVVSGTELYKIDTAYTSTLLGTVSGTGPVSMSDNGTQLFIACNPKGFIYNALTGVFVEITDVDFPGAQMVGYVDGYFVFTEPNSQRFWITSILEGTQIDPLDFASAEGDPDDLVSMIIDHREIWLFGTNSIEVWYDAGAPTFPFERIQGAVNEIGCSATYSVAKLDNSIFWLGGDKRGKGIIYRADGYTGKRVSTHAVEWQIQQYSTISDAVAYTYQQDGHAFYVLTFPTANATWVYDVSAQVWHERAAFVNGQFVRHRSNCQMQFAGTTIVGDYENSNLYAFDLDVYADNGAVQRWLRTWRALPTGQNNLKRTAHHMLQIDCEAGIGLNGVAFNAPLDTLLTESGLDLLTEDDIALLVSLAITDGVNPQFMLRFSDDGGHNWSNERWTSGGKIGETNKRVIYRRLGMTLALRDRVYELSGTDPVKIAIMGAELSISPTNS